jgi:hypothetical protein
VAARRRARAQGGRRPGRRPASSCTRRRATRLRAGDPLLTLHTDTPEAFDAALAALSGGYDIAPHGTDAPQRRLLLDRITAG